LWLATNQWGSKGICPLGRRAVCLGLPEKGRQGASWNEATVGRGKTKLFPLQVASASLDCRFGKAKSSRSLHPFLCILSTLFGREPSKDRS